MKKLMLSGLCGALLLGSANQANSDYREDIRDGLIVVAGAAAFIVLMAAVDHDSVRQGYFRLRERNFLVFDILKKVDASGLSLEDAAQEIVNAFSFEHYRCHAAIDKINEIVKGRARGLIRLNVRFRSIKRFNFLCKSCAKIWVAKLERKIEHINKISQIIKAMPAYEQEKQDMALSHVNLDHNIKNNLPGMMVAPAAAK